MELNRRLKLIEELQRQGGLPIGGNVGPRCVGPIVAANTVTQQEGKRLNHSGLPTTPAASSVISQTKQSRWKNAPTMEGVQSAIESAMQALDCLTSTLGGATNTVTGLVGWGSGRARGFALEVGIVGPTIYPPPTVSPPSS